MPTEKRPLKVFLCHASADKPKVRELYRYLLRRRIKPWFDEVDLVGGQDWQVEIPKALATSDAIIICLTKNSVDKEGYIQKEIKFALDKALEMPEGRVFLIPVRFEECEVPFSLSRYQWVDLFDEVGYSRMMRALKFRASQLERATVELPKTPVVAEDKNIILKNEQKSIEKAVRDSAEREAAEKTRREKAERRTAQIAALKETLSKSFISLKSTLAKVVPFFKTVSIIAVIIVLFWIGSWAVPRLASLIPTAKATATMRPSATYTFTNSPIPPTKTIKVTMTPTKTSRPSPTKTVTRTATSTRTSTTVPIIAVISAEPRSGKAPLTVNFSANLKLPDGSLACIQKANCTYYWFRYKTNQDNTTREFSYVFNQPGRWSMTVRVCYQGACDDATVIIDVK
jgi:hypothetical protein